MNYKKNLFLGSIICASFFTSVETSASPLKNKVESSIQGSGFTVTEEQALIVKNRGLVGDREGTIAYLRSQQGSSSSSDNIPLPPGEKERLEKALAAAEAAKLAAEETLSKELDETKAELASAQQQLKDHKDIAGLIPIIEKNIKKLQKRKLAIDALTAPTDKEKSERQKILTQLLSFETVLDSTGRPTTSSANANPVSDNAPSVSDGSPPVSDPASPPPGGGPPPPPPPGGGPPPPPPPGGGTLKTDATVFVKASINLSMKSVKDENLHIIKPNAKIYTKYLIALEYFLANIDYFNIENNHLKDDPRNSDNYNASIRSFFKFIKSQLDMKKQITRKKEILEAAKEEVAEYKKMPQNKEIERKIKQKETFVKNETPRIENLEKEFTIVKRIDNIIIFFKNIHKLQKNSLTYDDLIQAGFPDVKNSATIIVAPEIDPDKPIKFDPYEGLAIYQFDSVKEKYDSFVQSIGIENNKYYNFRFKMIQKSFQGKSRQDIDTLISISRYNKDIMEIKKEDNEKFDKSISIVMIYQLLTGMINDIEAAIQEKNEELKNYYLHETRLNKIEKADIDQSIKDKMKKDHKKEMDKMEHLKDDQLNLVKQKNNAEESLIKLQEQYEAIWGSGSKIKTRSE